MSVCRLWNRIVELTLAGVCATALFAGCGATREESDAGTSGVELIDPVGTASNYESAAYRTLYDESIYNALVCPYVEEFAPGDTMRFDGYKALPGEPVNKGDVLMESNTEEIQKQIAEKEKEIVRKEKDYQEDVKEAQEALGRVKVDLELWESVVESHEEAEPETDLPEHEAWEQDYTLYESRYRNALISVQKQEEALRQRKELYELDAAYDAVLLARMKEDRDRKTLLSGMTGVVANIAVLNYYDTMWADEPMAAVIDPDRKLIRCEYVSKSAVNKAADYYAIIDGKRYELEYEVMEQEERNQIAEKNDGKVYTTFYLKDGADEVEMGSFVTVVFLMEKKENVLTVPCDAVKRDEDTAYVYVLRNGENVYTPVKTGMRDGLYIEILSGVAAGDRVLTEKAPEPATSTVVLEMGSISSQFTARGYLFYPVQKQVTVPVKHGTAYFVSSNVELYQSVQKGEPLFTIQVKPDEAELTRKTRSLQRERERLNDLIKADAEGNRRMIEAKQETIRELEKEIAEIEADFALTEICAPYDGIVTFLLGRDLKEGDLLYTDEPLVVLAEGGSNYIVLEDSNGILTYNNTVSIKYRGAGGAETAVPGTVMSLGPYSVSQALFGNGENVLVRVSADDVGDMAGGIDGRYDAYFVNKRFDISAETRSTKNVLLVPRKAVVTEDGATYVRVRQEDGEVCYQRFVAGGFNVSYYWVAEGLTEGMEICLE